MAFDKREEMTKVLASLIETVIDRPLNDYDGRAAVRDALREVAIVLEENYSCYDVDPGDILFKVTGVNIITL